jgi:superfamily I DNA/RNA helicase/RecB family exonuclease
VSANPQWRSDALAALTADPAQSQVIIGAAGSGKTMLLVERVAHLIDHCGLHPDQVRVLTPSRLQATRLRDQVATRIPRATKGPFAKSVASLAFSIVTADHLSRGLPQPTLRSGADIDEDIRSLLTEHDDTSSPFADVFDRIVVRTETFRTELRELFARVIEHGHTSRDLVSWGKEFQKPEWVAAGQFMADYQQVIARSRPHSFEPAELIIRAASIVSHQIPAELADLRVLLVDDVHDIPGSARKLITAFTSWGVSVTAVGDPDSAGQTFRGSDPDSPALLADLLGVTPVYLQNVFRHGPTLRKAVSSLVGRVGSARAGQQRQATATAADPDTPILAITSGSATEEDAAIARCVRDRLDQGTPLSQVAVISRRAGALAGVARALGQQGIPSHLATRRPLSREPAARELLWWVQAALAPQDVTAERAVEMLGGVYGGWGALELRRFTTWIRLREASEDTRRRAPEVIRDVVVGSDIVIDAPDFLTRHVDRTRQIIERIRAVSDAPIDQVISVAWGAVGVENQWVEQSHASGEGSRFASRGLDAVVALSETAARFATTHPGVSAEVFVARVLNQDVAEDIIVPEPLTESVWLGTPSAAAGRQWATVIIHSLNDGVWPNTRLRGSLLGAPQVAWLTKGVAPGEIDQRRVVLDDEIRLAALAISRATNELVVSAVSADDTVPSPLFELITAGCPTWSAGDHSARDVRTLAGVLRRHMATSTHDEGNRWAALAYLASLKTPGAHPDDWWGLAPPTTTEPLFAGEVVRLSPSKVSNVEQSPLMWFLDTIAPEPLPPAVDIGAIIHKAWETNPWGPAENMAAYVDSRWSDIPFDSVWLAEAKRTDAHRQISALDHYLRDQRAQHVEFVASEKRFEVALPGAVMTGFIDRIVRDASGDVLVVDLKTGHYKTDSEVVEDAQLLAYQLALTTPEVTSEWGLDQVVHGGAYLLYVSSGKGGKPYRIAFQAPLDDEGRRVFLERLEAARQAVANHQFALGEGGGRAASGPPPHRWHLIGQVCGD